MNKKSISSSSRDRNRTRKNRREREKKMLGRLMTEWLTSAQCEEAPEKVRLLKSEKTESFCFSSSLFRDSTITRLFKERRKLL